MTGSASSDQSTDPAAPSGPVTGGSGQTTLVTDNLVEAVNLPLDHALAGDPDVLVLGEDVAANGGVFRATVNLKEKYGGRRVIDTPLAEGLIAGISVGMALQGLKPVAEIQFMGFLYAAMEQLVSHASRMRNRTRGRLSCPLVIRAPLAVHRDGQRGGGRGGGAAGAGHMARILGHVNLGESTAIPEILHSAMNE